MKENIKTVNEYIVAQPAAAAQALRQVRKIIRRAMPGAEEVISYKIPAYRLHGERVIFFAGWKQHYSLYPVGERLAAKFKNALARYEVSKGTIRFPLSEPVPEKLIERIAKYRATEIRKREKDARGTRK